MKDNNINWDSPMVMIGSFLLISFIIFAFVGWLYGAFNSEPNPYNDDTEYNHQDFSDRLLRDEREVSW